MVVSSAKFTILIFWSPFWTPLVSSYYQLNGQRLWLHQQINMEGVHPCYAMKETERRSLIYFNFRLNIEVSDLHQTDEFSS